MIQEEPGLFQVRLNEEGKKYIRKFAAISYTMLVVVIFQAGISVYWSIRMLARTAVSLGSLAGYRPTLYDKVYPYFSIFFSIAGVVSNIYYLKFPRVLLHSMEISDEYGANQAFGLLFRGALIFFFYLVISLAMMIWSLKR